MSFCRVVVARQAVWGVSNGHAGGMEPSSAAACEQCGTGLSGWLPVVAVMPDSSAVDPLHPERDGWRLLAACSEACLEALEERFRRRPFVAEELWAGKLMRVLRAHPQGALPLQLLHESGLAPTQMRAGFAWLDEQLRRGGPAK